MDIKLSILVCSTPERLTASMEMMRQLEKQAYDRPVEVLMLMDNLVRSIDEQKTSLIQLAQGEFIAFMDHHYSLSEDYIASLLDAIMQHPNVDAIAFNVAHNWNSSVGFGFSSKPKHLMCYAKRVLLQSAEKEGRDWVEKAIQCVEVQVEMQQALVKKVDKMACFMHVFEINNWMEIVKRQIGRLRLSGLYEKLDSIYISFVTERADDEEHIESIVNEIGLLAKSDDTMKIRVVPQTYDFERSTLKWLHQYCNESPHNVQILYMHTKGVARFGTFVEPFVRDWVHLMESVLVDHHEMCLKHLGSVDACGVNYLPSPKPHFSGNFWWANSEYIKKLDKEIGSDYLAPEMWLLSHHQSKFCCLFHSEVNHYEQPFSSKNIPILASYYQPLFYSKNGEMVKS
ncbi:hypothetical protein [Baia soyae]|uniref:Glycosyl transferase family 2 n=1 Tax=Baia soyae TaxID=1544746 RepID=A0A4R2SCI8_9BACL|nr:hypothetical protein [Baia soyae]TCP70626.1 hypothetical protein EDD57_10168 [Baia soyae]